MDRKAPRFLGLIYLVMIVLGISYIMNPACQSQGSKVLTHNELTDQIERDNIESITIQDSGNFNGSFRKTVELKKYFTGHIYHGLISGVTEKLQAKPNSPRILFDSSSPSFFWMFISSILPLMLMIGFFVLIARRMDGGSKALSFGRSKAKLAPSNKKVTFNDVAGQDEAKQELKEIVDFLKEPGKFQRLGGKIPKGVLLMGPPGTGKTLLARAVAGEANVPFFSISGSDFVEMFVGVGASRVRDLFEQGIKNAPCIVFMDEIDAVGRHRGAGLGGGHDEREQTLNQLLAEMDGFESHEGVIVIGATNRPDVLDPALLRPGRFDRRIVVQRPDLKGRVGILEVHTRKVVMDQSVNIEIIARGTAGFSGADLASLVNEAALNATRRNSVCITMEDLEFARDKVLGGSERRTMVISEEEKRTTAVHEAGHALLAILLENADPLYKVTIIPRGMALGLTMQLPTEDRYNYSKDYLNTQLAILMGGRSAEEILLNGQKTVGASNDIERATELARKMVCEWGMSENLGPLNFSSEEVSPFLGRSLAEKGHVHSEATAQKIDSEVSALVNNAYRRATGMLNKHKEVLDKIARELKDKETLTGEEIQNLVKEKEL